MKEQITLKDNILFIGSGMKPFENANGICTTPLMKALREKQKKVFYLDWMANGTETFTREDGIVICGPNSSGSNETSKIGSTECVKKSRFLKIKKCLASLYGRTLFPFHSVRRTIFLCKQADRICKENNIGVIVAFYQPFVTLFAGYYSKCRNKAVSFIPYYFDLISNPYIPFKFNSVRRQKQIAKKWENRINKKALFPIYMVASQSFHNKYHSKKSWFDKIKYLDIPLYAPRKQETKRQEKEPSAEINLLFCGYIGDHRNVEYFLKILSKLPDQVKFTLVGNITANQNKVLKEFDQRHPGRIHYVGYVEHEKLSVILEDADCLVNFGVLSQTAISAKTYEYISYCKPIIMTYAIDEEPSVRILKKYPLSYFIDERKDIDEQSISRLFAFLQKARNERIDITALDNEFSLNKAETFANLITSI